jgi:cytochrome c oxidase subunit 2
MRAPSPILVLMSAAILTGCTATQSALDAQGFVAVRVAQLFWMFTAVCAVVWLLVVFAMLYAIVRSPVAGEADPLVLRPRAERGAQITTALAAAATVVILVVFTAASYLATRSFGAAGARDEVVRIKVTGHQWWWEIQYQDAQPDRNLVTANEMHIPIGRPVRLQLVGADVIHSFWVPSLAGKQDLVPGRDNEMVFVADRTGVYRGQCAEFCGLQHAHMSMLVIAEEPHRFEAWREAQLKSAEEPRDSERSQGLDVFSRKACFACHAIRGTKAAASIAPDLTHVASRRTIAAGVLPMSRGSLAAWVTDPQQIKPGTNMPRVDLSADELNALAAYLVGLE